MNKVLKIIKLTVQPKLMKVLLNMPFNSYLDETGWIRSLSEMSPVDKLGEPLPWVTLPFIDFISTKLKKDMSVFEYGAGNSTLYFSDKVQDVTSVEHDREWYLKIKKQSKRKNIDVHFQKLVYGGEYAKYAKLLDKKFDLIIVDGRDRVNCIKNSIRALTADGCIVLDDSERKQYFEGIEFLLEKGFKKLDFWGMAPGLTYKKCTTIFYKKNNCFEI